MRQYVTPETEAENRDTPGEYFIRKFQPGIIGNALISEHRGIHIFILPFQFCNFLQFQIYIGKSKGAGDGGIPDMDHVFFEGRR